MTADPSSIFVSVQPPTQPSPNIQGSQCLRAPDTLVRIPLETQNPQSMPDNAANWKRMVEFVLLFFLLPLGFRFKTFPFPVIPAMWLLTAYCLACLLGDVSFDRKLLWNRRALSKFWIQIVLLFVILALLLAGAIYLVRPERLFNFVKRAPLVWLLVMILYPVLSVYPQGIVFRSFLFHRYRNLFKRPWVMIAASALAFSFAHIIFCNLIAVIFTLAGGVIFAWRYHRSESLFVSAFEHALYGCWMFTVGLGEFFYRGMR
jgi:CAAX protease family protein